MRYAAAIGGLAFEDEFETKEEHGKKKAEGLRRWSGPPEVTAFDKDGKAITALGQSNACLRFIGIYIPGIFVHFLILAYSRNFG